MPPLILEYSNKTIEKMLARGVVKLWNTCFAHYSSKLIFWLEGVILNLVTLRSECL